MSVTNVRAARVLAETLTDGSTVYDVHQPLDGGDCLKFACVSKTHADQLAALLDECAAIDLDRVQS